MNIGDLVCTRRYDGLGDIRNGSCMEDNESTKICEIHRKEQIEGRGEGHKDMTIGRIVVEQLWKIGILHPATSMWKACCKRKVALEKLWKVGRHPASHNLHAEILLQKRVYGKSVAEIGIRES